METTQDFGVVAADDGATPTDGADTFRRTVGKFKTNLPANPITLDPIREADISTVGAGILVVVIRMVLVYKWVGWAVIGNAYIANQSRAKRSETGGFATSI